MIALNLCKEMYTNAVDNTIQQAHFWNAGEVGHYTIFPHCFYTIFPHCSCEGRGVRSFRGLRPMAFNNKIVYGHQLIKIYRTSKSSLPYRNVLEMPETDMIIKANLLLPLCGLANGGGRAGEGLHLSPELSNRTV